VKLKFIGLMGLCVIVLFGCGTTDTGIEYDVAPRCRLSVEYTRDSPSSLWEVVRKYHYAHRSHRILFALTNI